MAGGSYPARGMWIEIERGGEIVDLPSSYPARGMWIEIPQRIARKDDNYSRTPRGVCGLKFLLP